MKPWVFNRHFFSKPTEPQEGTPMVVESLDTPAPSTSWFRDAIHPVQFGIFPNRLLLPHPDDEMLSGSEGDVSSIRDGKTVWVTVDLASILERHLVISNSAKPIFREAQDRRHSSPNPECFNNDVPNRSREQRKLSILTWNLGPRRGKEGAIYKHITGKWHIIALQGAIEHLEHDYLTSHFYVTHYGGCSIVQQRHFSLGKQSYFRLPPRYHRSAVGRERKTIRMGARSCHTASFQRLPRKRQIVLHHDVITLLECLSISTRTTGILRWNTIH